MSSFEWMELQTLSREIAAARSRLVAARSGRNARHTRSLEHEIAVAETRRTGLISSITHSLVGGPATDRGRGLVIAALPTPAPPAAFATANSANGGRIMWERLTPSDLGRATGELDRRRAETLKRHAAELSDLDADRTELERLEQAIDAFMRKFNAPMPGGEIALLGARPETRLQALG